LQIMGALNMDEVKTSKRWWEVIPTWAPLAIFVMGGVVFGVQAGSKVDSNSTQGQTNAKDIATIQIAQEGIKVTQANLQTQLDRIETKVDTLLAERRK
jgi:hypothetical protein